jgi:tetratricopeptide (TPR) repeat protein
LKLASRDLAENILESKDRGLAGIVFLNQGQVERALAALKQASERQPNDLPTKLALCEGMEANEFYENAVSCYTSALSLSPRSPEIEEQLVQARWLYGNEGNREGALRDFEKLAHERHYTRALLGLGKALDDTGEHAKALSVYDEFLKTGSDASSIAIAHVGKATAFAKLGQHKEALREFMFRAVTGNVERSSLILGL